MRLDKGMSKVAYRQQWQRYVDAWRASGLSKKDFCTQHALPAWQLNDWIQRLTPTSPAPAPILSQNKTIIPVQLVSQPIEKPVQATTPLRLKTKHIALHFAELPPPLWLADVLQALS